MENQLKSKIPADVMEICNEIKNSGFKAYLVGGTVRDLLSGQNPRDYDITTDAPPHEIKKIFPKVVEVGIEHGTVIVISSQDRGVEITTFRDGKTLTGDLARRDFTINAIAYCPFDGNIFDPFQGLKDLKKGLIRAVGSAEERFKEDPIRMFRAIRIGVEKNFSIDDSIIGEIKRNATTIKKCAIERIRMEFSKLLLTEGVDRGLYLLRDTGLLKEILPELMDCVGVEQRKDYHNLDVFNHIVQTVKNTPPDEILRLSALFHDIGKPATRSMDKRGVIHFYGHEKVSEKIALKVLTRLKYPKKIIEKVRVLVLNHMAPVLDSEKTFRKVISRLGNYEDALKYAQLKLADYLASNRNGDAYTLFDKLVIKIENVFKAKEALTVKDLALNGEEIMKYLNLTPGPAVGKILERLFEMVLENPELNRKEILLKYLARIKENVKK